MCYKFSILNSLEAKTKDSSHKHLTPTQRLCERQKCLEEWWVNNAATAFQVENNDNVTCQTKLAISHESLSYLCLFFLTDMYKPMLCTVALQAQHLLSDLYKSEHIC